MTKKEIYIVKTLLEEWETVLKENLHRSSDNAINQCGSLNNKIQDPKGECVIFDSKGYVKQTHIQGKLAKLLPNLRNIIYSEPNINDYKWTIKDYLQLYFSHYTIVIEKIREFGINKNA